MSQEEHKKLLQSRLGVGSIQYQQHIEAVRSRQATGEDVLALDDISNPPTAHELDVYVDMPVEALPVKYRRQAEHRIYCNRELRLDLAKYFGFDMDYTLAVYNSPAYEILSFDLILAQLLSMGYPEDLKVLKYDPDFSVRGIFLDRTLGNFLKVDAFGTILVSVHGRVKMTLDQTLALYPSMRVHDDDIGSRFYLLDTLFAHPLACLMADTIMTLEAKFGRSDQGKAIGNDDTFQISYQNLFDDIRTAVDWVHQRGELKSRTLEQLPLYVRRDPRLPVMLTRMRERGKTFLLTNSDYYYTRPVMTYLLEGFEEGKVWTDYFDIVIVDAAKPAFFRGGTALRQVEPSSGSLMLTSISRLEQGAIYKGGSLEAFTKLTGAQGHEVLFVGDHIFGDIIKSKKTQGWNTLMIIPELTHEIQMWKSCESLFTHLQNLEFIRAEVFRGLASDVHESNAPNITELRARMRSTVEAIDQRFNSYFGSLFRSGSKKSFFAMQVQRYADLYSADCLNLSNYPLFYPFRVQDRPMPHETGALQ